MLTKDDSSVSIKHDFEKMKEIGYRHLGIDEIAQDIDIYNEKSSDFVEYIKEEKIIIDTSKEEDEESVIAHIFNSLILKSTKSTEKKVFSKNKFAKGYDVKFKREPQFFEERHEEDGSLIMMYRRPFVKEEAFEKIIKAIHDIYTYSPKAISALSTVEGLSESPDKNKSNENYMFSQTTKLPLMNYSIFSNADIGGYGAPLTTIMKTSKGYHSLYSLTELHPELALSILKKTKLSDFADKIVKEILADLESKRSVEKKDENTVSHLLKQIYFPVNNKEDHLIVIVNHIGFRKAISDYMMFLKNSSLYYVGRSKANKIRIPTRTICIGGANPINSGEVMASLSGKLRTLYADAPKKHTVNSNTLSPSQLEKLYRTKNVFSLVSYLHINISTDDAEKRNFHILKLFSDNGKNNKYTKDFKEVVLRELAYKMLYPVFKAVSNKDAYQDLLPDMSEDMQKLIAPDVYKGSMSSKEYRSLADMAYEQMSQSLVIKIDGEIQMLDDNIVDVLKKQIEKIMRDI